MVINMKRFKTTLAVVLTAVIAGGGAWCGHGFYIRSKYGEIISKSIAVQSTLERSYLYDYDQEKAADYAAMGITASLDDPYTTYYDKGSFKSYMDTGSGDFVGIGVVISKNDRNELIVLSVEDGSGAAEAGVRQDDVITAIDGVAYSGSQINEAVAYVKGAGEKKDVADTPVKLSIRRNDTENIEMEVFRKRIHTDSVSGKMIADGLGYIRITKFNSVSESNQKDTADEFKAVLDDLTGQGMKKMILDLRSNPGGSESSVCRVADMMVPEGLIMYTEDKYGRRQEKKSDSNEINIPIAVLMNGESASASELLAGALRDYGKAVLVGEKSFGKGIMQSVVDFWDGSGMSVTIARYFTPKGTCVQDVGLLPDYEVSLSEEAKKIPLSQLSKEQDSQLQKAIEVLG